MQTGQLLLTLALITAVAVILRTFVFAKNYGFNKKLNLDEKEKKIVVERDILFCGLLTIYLGVCGLASYEINPTTADIVEITIIVLFCTLCLCMPAYLAGIYKRKWISI